MTQKCKVQDLQQELVFELEKNGYYQLANLTKNNSSLATEIIKLYDQPMIKRLNELNFEYYIGSHDEHRNR